MALDLLEGPISPGRTTWCSSSRKTGTRAAAISSSIWVDRFGAPPGCSGRPTSRGCDGPRPGSGRLARWCPPSMNWLKYLKMDGLGFSRWPATLRKVWVKDRDPSRADVRPRASSPNRDSAITLLPLPGPPVTAMTRFVFLHRACSTACMTSRPLVVGCRSVELLAVANFGGGDFEQLLTGRRPSEQDVRRSTTGTGAEPGLQKVQHRAPCRPPVKSRPVVGYRELQQVRDQRIGGIVEVGHACQRVRLIRQRSSESARYSQ